MIGTNTLDLLYDGYCQNISSFVPTSYGYRAILKILEIRHKYSQDGSLGLINLPGQTLEVIPAYSTVLLEGVVTNRGSHLEKWALIEPPSDSSLPCGVFVTSCLIILPSKQSSRLPVVLHNETGHVILPPKLLLAELSAVKSINHQHSVSQPDSSQSDGVPKQPEPSASPSLNFDFDG